VRGSGRASLVEIRLCDSRVYGWRFFLSGVSCRFLVVSCCCGGGIGGKEWCVCGGEEEEEEGEEEEGGFPKCILVEDR